MEAFSRKKNINPGAKLISDKQNEHDLMIQKENEYKRQKEEEKRQEKLKWIENELIDYKKQEERRKQKNQIIKRYKKDDKYLQILRNKTNYEHENLQK